VGEARRNRVLQAAKELGYTPNKFASALARKATGRVLFLDCNKLAAHDRVNQAYYAGLYKMSLEAVLGAVESSTYHLTIDLNGSAKPGDYDGIILFDVDSPEQVAPFLSSGIPTVYGHHLGGFSKGLRAGVDNKGGSVLAAQYLLDRGHRGIAYLTGRVPELNSHKDRLEGFVIRLEEANLGCTILQTPVGPRGGARGVQSLEKKLRAGSITAIGVMNDLTAFGAVQELLRLGIRIPEDVEVVGFDNLPILDLLPVRIPTVDLSLDEVYSRAAKKLLSSLESQGEQEELLVLPRLIRPNSNPGDPK